MILTAASIEFNKIIVRRKYWVLLLIQLVLCALTVFFTSMNGFAYVGISVDIPQIPYIILNLISVFVLPLIIFMLCADVFAHEVEDLTIKCVLLRPITRLKIFLTKFSAIAAYVFLNLLATFASVAIMRIIFSGGDSGILEMFSAYTLTLLPMLSFIALGAFIALAISHSSMSMFCSLIVYISMHGITLVSAKIGAVFFTSHLEWYKMFAGISIDVPGVLNRFLLFASYAVFLGVGGVFLLERKEL